MQGSRLVLHTQGHPRFPSCPQPGVHKAVSMHAGAFLAPPFLDTCGAKLSWAFMMPAACKLWINELPNPQPTCHRLYMCHFKMQGVGSSVSMSSQIHSHPCCRPSNGYSFWDLGNFPIHSYLYLGTCAGSCKCTVD